MSALSTAGGIILSRVRGRSLARRIARATVPVTPVAVYFADAPTALYQLRRWYQTLEALNETYPVSIITSDPLTYETIRTETTVAVTFATGPTQLDRALTARQVRVVLYPNHNALNFRVLRFARPVHVFIGHGDSAKDSSVSRQLKAYDYTWVADEQSIEPLRGIRGYDADAAAVVVGSPWLGFAAPPPPDWHADQRPVVLYAPTWEGDRPTMDYSSVETCGEAIVAAVLGTPGLRLVYRPHPWLGRVRPETAEMDARIRRTVAAAGDGHVVDTGAYGWSLEAADLCITDVSSVAFDARALAKPLVVTVPTSGSVPRVPDTAYAGAARLAKTSAHDIREVIDETLAAAAHGAASPSTSMDLLVAAVREAIRISDETPPQGANSTL
jgi:hypothetical protein